MNRSAQLSGKKFEEQEWQKLFNQYQQQYIRTRLEAIKWLHDGKTRQEVMARLAEGVTSTPQPLVIYRSEKFKPRT